MNAYETEHGYDPDPWHPLVHLAGFEVDPIHAERAAEFLGKQGKENMAREAEVRGDKHANSKVTFYCLSPAPAKIVT